MSRFLDPLLDAPMRAHHLVNSRTGHTVADSIAPAFDSRSRRKGLLGRDGLQPGEALIIAPCQAVHTWFMQFAIDVAFVSKQGRVVSLTRRMRPWRLAMAFRAFSVVELPEGTLEGTGTKVGDVLTIVPV